MCIIQQQYSILSIRSSYTAMTMDWETERLEL